MRGDVRLMTVFSDSFFYNYTATTKIYTYCHALSLHYVLTISRSPACSMSQRWSSSKAVLNTSFSSSLRKSRCCTEPPTRVRWRSEEHTSELQSLMRISYAVFCLKKKILQLPETNTLSNKSSLYT